MTKTLFYAGIGSRRTPPEMLARMRKLARRLAQLGFVLRSGAADGADAAFEAGCDEVQGAKSIWLPWKGFNGHSTEHCCYPTPAHEAVAAQFHPVWSRLSQGPRKLHSRNVGQCLGEDLATPVAFVLAWTPDGCESGTTRTRDTGGTGMAIAIASQHGIPVINLRNPNTMERLKQLVLELTGQVPADTMEAPEPEQVAEPVNIWSGCAGLGGALTNMSERAREKGCIKHAYPVTVNGVAYPDSEAAYQAMKIPGRDDYNDGLMVDLIALKFLQHSILFERVTGNGGVAWLEKCSHFTQATSERAQSWEGQGHGSRFIRNLIAGYLKARDGRGPLTRVVHVKDAPFDVYIGRQMGTGVEYPDSIWSNPFKISSEQSREAVVAQYHDYVRERPELIAQVLQLRGRTLGCWCKTRDSLEQLCHGDVLAALAEGKAWTPPAVTQGSLW